MLHLHAPADHHSSPATKPTPHPGGDDASLTRRQIKWLTCEPKSMMSTSRRDRSLEACRCVTTVSCS